MHRRLGEYWKNLQTRSTASGGKRFWNTYNMTRISYWISIVNETLLRANANYKTKRPIPLMMEVTYEHGYKHHINGNGHTTFCIRKYNLGEEKEHVKAVRQSTCRMKQFFMTSFKQGFFELEPANLSFSNQQT